MKINVYSEDIDAVNHVSTVAKNGKKYQGVEFISYEKGGERKSAVTFWTDDLARLEVFFQNGVKIMRELEEFNDG